MRREVFLDTQGWIALLNAADDHHLEAVRIWLELAREKAIILLTDWIIAETGNGLARSRARGVFRRAVEELGASARLQCIQIREEIQEQALDWYDRFHDKGWGLVDCSSFVIMKERGIQDALTRDRHFAQAGFVTLLH